MGGAMAKLKQRAQHARALWKPTDDASSDPEMVANLERIKFLDQIDGAARRVAMARADASKVYIKVLRQAWTSKKIVALLSEDEYDANGELVHRLPRETQVALHGRVMRARWGAKRCSYERSFVACLTEFFPAEEIDIALNSVSKFDVEGRNVRAHFDSSLIF